MGGGDLNTKKSWHPNNMKNQERVWKAEQVAANEKNRILELQREREEERDHAQLKELAQRNFGAHSSASSDNRLHWMYDKPDKQAQEEDYLLGKAIGKSDEGDQASQNAIPALSRRVVGSSMTTTGDDSQVDLARKLREDPLLLVKERERAARAALLNNPLQRKKLTELLRKEQEHKKQKESKNKKKNKKKGKDLDNELAAKLNALAGKKGINLSSLLNSDDSSDSSSSDEKSKRTKKKKKREKKSKRKHQSSESDTDSSDDDVDKRNKSSKNKKEKVSSKSHKDKKREPRKRQSDETSESEVDTKRKKRSQDLKRNKRESECGNNRRKQESIEENIGSKSELSQDNNRRDWNPIRAKHVDENYSQNRGLTPRREGQSGVNRGSPRESQRGVNRGSPRESQRGVNRGSPRESQRGVNRGSPRESQRRGSPSKERQRRVSSESPTRRDDQRRTSPPKRKYDENRRNMKQGLSEKERAARLAEMAAAGLEREVERGHRVAKQRAEDAAGGASVAPRALRHEARALPDSLESRIHSNRHYIQRDRRYMNEHFARR